MKRFLCLMMLLCLFLSLSACVRETSAGVSYQVYYLNSQGDFQAPALASQSCSVSEGEEAVDVLLAQLLEEPTKENLNRSIPKGVTVRGWKLENGMLTVDFSRRYGSLSGIELTLADYSVTMTLNQIEGVESVVTTVEADPITYRDHQNLRPADVRLALHRREPVEREVYLWALTETQDGVTAVRQAQTIVLGVDESLTTAVLYALIQRAEEGDLLGLPTKLDILSARVMDKVCSLNLSAAFYETAPEDEGQTRAGIAALTLSLCELDGIDAVRFQREGEAVARYGTIPLGEMLRPEDIQLPDAPAT